MAECLRANMNKCLGEFPGLQGHVAFEEALGITQRTPSSSFLFMALDRHIALKGNGDRIKAKGSYCLLFGRWNDEYFRRHGTAAAAPFLDNHIGAAWRRGIS